MKETSEVVTADGRLEDAVPPKAFLGPANLSGLPCPEIPSWEDVQADEELEERLEDVDQDHPRLEAPLEDDHADEELEA